MLTRTDSRAGRRSVGRVTDRFLFRPFLGWATAWSFDRLRVWIEHGIPPEVSRDRTIRSHAPPIQLSQLAALQFSGLSLTGFSPRPGNGDFLPPVASPASSASIVG